MERHAAVPHRGDLERMREEEARLIEKHIAEPPAEQHADRHIKQQIVRRVPARKGAYR